MTVNRREAALSLYAGQPELPPRKDARPPFVPVLVPPLAATDGVRRATTLRRRHVHTDDAGSIDDGLGAAAVDHAALLRWALAMRPAQMKPLSSRATATTVFGELFPLAVSRRNRRCSRISHFSAIDVAQLG